MIDAPLRNNRTAFDRASTRFNTLTSKGQHTTPEAAALFYYLNCTGFNGLCRFNQTGHFSVPFGRHKTIDCIRDSSHYQDTLTEWMFLSVDCEQVPLERGDFIDADPPYDVDFTSYAKDGFAWNDQV